VRPTDDFTDLETPLRFLEQILHSTHAISKCGLTKNTKALLCEYLSCKI